MHKTLPIAVLHKFRLWVDGRASHGFGNWRARANLYNSLIMRNHQEKKWNGAEDCTADSGGLSSLPTALPQQLNATP